MVNGVKSRWTGEHSHTRAAAAATTAAAMKSPLKKVRKAPAKA